MNSLNSSTNLSTNNQLPNPYPQVSRCIVVGFGWIREYFFDVIYNNFSVSRVKIIQNIDVDDLIHSVIKGVIVPVEQMNQELYDSMLQATIDNFIFNLRDTSMDHNRAYTLLSLLETMVIRHLADTFPQIDEPSTRIHSHNFIDKTTLALYVYI